MNPSKMQPQNRAFLESLDWNGWRGTAGRDVDAEEKDLGPALDQLRRQTEDILSEYEERSSFTSPSKERRKAKERAKYRQRKRVQDRPKGRGSS